MKKVQFEIKNNLLKIMDEKGINTKVLSKNANLNKCTISHLRGKSTLNTTTLETLMKLADALGVDPTELYSVTRKEV